METLFGFDDLAPRNQGGLPGASNHPPLLPSDRERVIARIIEINVSASASFLGQFTTEQLALYLEHLVSSQGPRGRDAVWQRPGDSPAVLVAQSAA